MTFCSLTVHPAKIQLITEIWIYFWTQNSIPFIYISVLMLVPYSAGYYTFIVSLKSRSMNLPTLSILFNIFKLFLAFCLSIWILGTVCQYKKKKKKKKNQGWILTGISLWFMNVGCLSTYLDFLYFVSKMLCSFHCTSYIYSIKFILKYFLFCATIRRPWWLRQ